MRYLKDFRERKTPLLFERSETLCPPPASYSHSHTNTHIASVHLRNYRLDGSLVDIIRVQLIQLNMHKWKKKDEVSLTLCLIMSIKIKKTHALHLLSLI